MIRKKRTIFFNSIIIALLLTIGFGCTPSIRRMMPNMDKAKLSHNNKSIKILEASGQKIKNAGHIFDVQLTNLNSKKLTKLIRVSFEKSGMFKKVVLDGSADYALTANIKYQAQRSDTYAAVESLIRIQYEIYQVNTNQVIWQDEIVSKNTVKFFQKLNGKSRAVKSLEGAVKKNMTELINKVSQINFLP